MGADRVYQEKGFMKKKLLFLIHDLGHGGAEKVLVNLVNNEGVLNLSMLEKE